MLTWTIFVIAILVALAIDLGLHNKSKISLSSAIGWSLFWILLAFGFNGWIYYERGVEPALNFLAGYLVEKSLSVDNLFVFLVIFKTFQIPHHLRHKVLFWGVIGAFFLRGLFILGGVALVNQFQFVLPLFGLFLIYTGIKLAFQSEEEIHPEKNPIIVWFQKWMPIDSSHETEEFFTKKNNLWHATPLFIALLAVNIIDVIFAVDSIPAILGITTDPMIVLTSNMFAILGLRSLYFVLEKTLDLFQYLHYGLAAILIFIGVKMVIADYYHISIVTSLSFIAMTLLISILSSIFLGNIKK